MFRLILKFQEVGKYPRLYALEDTAQRPMFILSSEITHTCPTPAHAAHAGVLRPGETNVA